MTESTEQDSHPLGQFTAQNDPIFVENKDIASKNTRPAAKSPPNTPLPSLSPLNMDEPALIIDANLRIAWQNNGAITKIWHNISTANNGNPNPWIFDLIFDSQFQRIVKNWRKWAFYFIQQAQHMLTVEDLEGHIKTRDADQQLILKELLNPPPTQAERIVHNSHIRQALNDGLAADFQVMATQFEQGRYFIFKSFERADKTSPELISADIDQRFDLLRRKSHPGPMPFYILAARLNKTHVFRTEMLAEEYSQLLTRLYKQVIGCIEKHGGIFQKLTSSDFLGCFLPNSEQQVHPMQVIECALVLKNQMAELGREWKIRKGWLHDIELNMGLHRTNEYIGAVTSSIGENITTFGDAQRIATALSALASNGEIWATKDVINQIDAMDQKKLRFGILRKGHPHQVLISKCFSGLKELTVADNRSMAGLDSELGALAATQIFDRVR